MGELDNARKNPVLLSGIAQHTVEKKNSGLAPGPKTKNRVDATNPPGISQKKVVDKTLPPIAMKHEVHLASGGARLFTLTNNPAIVSALRSEGVRCFGSVLTTQCRFLRSHQGCSHGSLEEHQRGISSGAFNNILNVIRNEYQSGALATQEREAANRHDSHGGNGAWKRRPPVQLGREQYQTYGPRPFRQFPSLPPTSGTATGPPPTFSGPPASSDARNWGGSPPSVNPFQPGNQAPIFQGQNNLPPPSNPYIPASSSDQPGNST